MTIKSIFWPFTSAISRKNNTSPFGNFSIYLLSLFFLGLFLIVFNQDSSLRKTNLNLDEKLPQQKISDSFYLNLTKPYKNISYKIESNDSLNKILNEHSINKNEVVECSAKKNLQIKDLTGAGDLFAGGFLHGLINNKSIRESLETGTEMSSKVIQIIGARLDRSNI